MARKICVQPCAPNAALSVNLPFMGDMSAQASLTLEGGCADCDVVSNILIQLAPALGSLGIPICLLGCVASVIGALQAVTDLVLDPAAFTEALVNVGEKCKCVLEFALPFPAGAVCEMLKTVYGVLGVVNAAVNCVVGIIGDIVQINLRADFLGESNVVASQEAAACVRAQSQAMMDALNQKFGTIGGLLAMITPIIDFIATPLEAVPVVGEALTQLKDGMLVFSGSVPVGTPPAEYLNAILGLQVILRDVLDVLAPVVGACP